MGDNKLLQGLNLGLNALQMLPNSTLARFSNFYSTGPYITES